MYVVRMYTLCYIDPPQRFDHKMKTNKFLLLLNTNGISYKVCKKLKGIIKLYETILCCTKFNELIIFQIMTLLLMTSI